MRRIYTFEFTESALNRVTDEFGYLNISIVCCLYDDSVDRYVTLIECEPRWATLLSLI